MGSTESMHAAAYSCDLQLSAVGGAGADSRGGVSAAATTAPRCSPPPLEAPLRGGAGKAAGSCSASCDESRSPLSQGLAPERSLWAGLASGRSAERRGGDRGRFPLGTRDAAVGALSSRRPPPPNSLWQGKPCFLAVLPRSNRIRPREVKGLPRNALLRILPEVRSGVALVLQTTERAAVPLG